jgi:hypothetical protein
MKLNSTQIEQTLNQFRAQVIADDNPMLAELNDLFGDHTFFLDGRGRRGDKSGGLERCDTYQATHASTRTDGHSDSVERDSTLMWSSLVRVLPLMNDSPDSPKVTLQFSRRAF